MVFPKIWFRNQSLDSVENACPSPSPLPTYSWSEDQGAPAIYHHTSGASIAAIRMRMTSPAPTGNEWISARVQRDANRLTMFQLGQPPKLEWPCPAWARCMK